MASLRRVNNRTAMVERGLMYPRPMKVRSAARTSTMSPGSARPSIERISPA